MSDPQVRIIMACILGAISAVLLWQSFRDQRHRRLITDTPTSRARGVFVGFNEVVGVATADNPLVTRFTREPCVWFDYHEQQEIRRATDSSGTRSRRVWIDVGRGRDAMVFQIVDDTGTVHVDPVGAEIIGNRITSGIFTAPKGLISYVGRIGPTGRFRRREDAIRVGDQVYVLGPAHLADGGTRTEIRAEPDQPYFITTRGEAALTRMFRIRGIAGLLVAAVVGGCATAVLAGSSDAVSAVRTGVIGFGLVLFASACFAAVFVYNGLVRLREREARAWSLIEVQLSRRAELIPRLVACVAAYATGEGDVQERLAAIRSGTWQGTTHDLPDDADVEVASVAATEQAEAVRTVIGLSEAYPELKADELFADLHDQLVDSENRIALARGFFNESVMALWDRARTFPASVIASRIDVGTRRMFTLAGEAG